MRRIHAREWKPGQLIPNESDLAREFGCARTTVNRALRSLAETGLLDRRRKAGTRVAEQPVAQAVLSIPLLRHEVEQRGARYDYQRIERAVATPPTLVSAALHVDAKAMLLHVHALHPADGRPYALEDRWINTGHVPAALEEDFQSISANEWLLKHVPYTSGDIAFSATTAAADIAMHLDCPENSALLTIDRLTWDQGHAVTKARLLFAPGHQLRAQM